MKEDLRVTLKRKINEFDGRIRNSFVLIREDINELTKTVDLMRSFLKERERKFENAWIDEDKLRKKLKNNVDEFNQNILQLKIALASVRKIQKDLVLTGDLANIEEGIKISFKNEILGYREELKSLREIVKESDRKIGVLEKGVIKNGNGEKNGSKRKWSFWSNQPR
ncbi:MAG: hypothetical protein NUV97_04180 [archaeon]|nr:hypothetical protein [archaeon]MCR4323552.1 hypothetical protein [Nanoarchaeota archaeon]